MSDQHGNDAQLHEGPARVPHGVPIRVLGVSDRKYVFLDGLAQIITFKSRELNRLSIIGLFGGISCLSTNWPARDHAGNPDYDDFDARQARRALIATCKERDFRAECRRAAEQLGREGARLAAVIGRLNRLGEGGTLA
jgi:hypothetical protein